MLVKKGLGIYILFISLVLIFGCAQPQIGNVNSLGKNIICFGDSLTSGEGAREGYDYPNILAKMLSYPVINAGFPGDTTKTALKRLKEDVLDKDPLIVVVILGGNDFLQKIPKEEVFKNLREIVIRIQERRAMVVLGEVRVGFLMKDFSKGYRKIAKAYHAALIPNLLGGILNNPSLRSDSVHPNEKGYRLMAERVQKVIEPLIEENAKIKTKLRSD